MAAGLVVLAVACRTPPPPWEVGNPILPLPAGPLRTGVDLAALPDPPTPEPGAPMRTVALISAPWVTSGSSPASLITAAVARLGRSDLSSRSKLGRCPPGSWIVTGSGNRPVKSATYAALVAAAAQAPVAAGDVVDRLEPEKRGHRRVDDVVRVGGADDLRLLEARHAGAQEALVEVGLAPPLALPTDASAALDATAAPPPRADDGLPDGESARGDGSQPAPRTVRRTRQSPHAYAATRYQRTHCGWIHCTSLTAKN